MKETLLNLKTVEGLSILGFVAVVFLSPALVKTGAVIYGFVGLYKIFTK